MELKQECIQGIQDLTNDYMDKEIDKSYIRELMHILSKSVERDVKYHFDDKGEAAYFDTIDKEIYINLEKLKNSIGIDYKVFREVYPDIDITIFNNFFILYTLLHEYTHLQQLDDKFKINDTPEEIKRAYNLLTIQMNRSALARLKYKFKQDVFFNERNAWIESSIDMFSIYEGTELEDIVNNMYLASIMSGYDNKSFPIGETYKMIHLPYGFDLRGISFKDLFYNGFDIDLYKYKLITDYIDSKNMKELNVKDIDAKIRSLR
jgi:hypothetical protein